MITSDLKLDQESFNCVCFKILEVNKNIMTFDDFFEELSTVCDYSEIFTLLPKLEKTNFIERLSPNLVINLERVRMTTSGKVEWAKLKTLL